MTKSDLLIKNQAIKRELQAAERRKRKINLPNGYGHSIVGSVHDCSRSGFEKALKTYWSKLYVGWNPFKKEGKGCWEVWQQPSKKTAVLWGYIKNHDFSTFKSALTFHDKFTAPGQWSEINNLEYVPNDFEHWVADLDYLSYDFIAKLREMDAWNNKQLISDHDEAYEEHKRKLEKEEEENIKYVVKHNKQIFRDLLDYTQQGFNPLDFFNKK